MRVLSKRHLGLVVTEFISSFFVGSVLLIFLWFIVCFPDTSICIYVLSSVL